MVKLFSSFYLWAILYNIFYERKYAYSLRVKTFPDKKGK